MIAIDARKLGSPLTRNDDGTVSWTRLPGDKYVVTGVDCRGRRLRVESDGWQYARSINVWQGSRWLLRGGKRWLIQRVTN